MPQAGTSWGPLSVVSPHWKALGTARDLVASSSAVTAQGSQASSGAHLQAPGGLGPPLSLHSPLPEAPRVLCMSSALLMQPQPPCKQRLQSGACGPAFTFSPLLIQPSPCPQGTRLPVGSSLVTLRVSSLSLSAAFVTAYPATHLPRVQLGPGALLEPSRVFERCCFCFCVWIHGLVTLARTCCPCSLRTPSSQALHPMMQSAAYPSLACA